MDLWKYVAVICGGILCAPFCTVCTKRQEGAEEKEVGCLEAFISTPFECLVPGPQQKPCSRHVRTQI